MLANNDQTAQAIRGAAEPPPPPSDLRQVERLLRYLMKEGRVMHSPVLALTVLSSLCRAALIFSVNRVAAGAAGEPSAIAILFASVIATLVVTYFARIAKQVLSEQMLRDLRVGLSAKLLRADISFLQQRDHGQIYTIVTQETRRVSDSSVKVLGMVEGVLLLLVCAPYLFWLSWVTGAATVAAIAIGGLGFILADAPARAFTRRSYQASAEFCDRVNDVLAGWMEIRLRRSRREAIEHDAIRLADDVRDNAIKASRLFSIGETFAQASLIALLCSIVIVLPLLEGAGSATMFQVLTLVLFAYGPIEQIFSTLPDISRAATAKYKIDEVEHELSSGREIAQTGASGTVPAGFRTIELRGVTAVLGGASTRGQPGDDRFEIGPIDLTFRPGETVFISGGNGAGKSTLMAIITGLRLADGGDILLDGKPVDIETIGQYRSLFSAVFSQFHLFRQPYGLDDIEKRALAELIDELGLDERVRLIEGGFSTLALSSGQKRRLALAVALAESRPIIVFDEFAADQDPARRAFFYDVLLPQIAKAGHLVIAVTHDEHRFGQCDRLIRMEAGRVVSDTRVERQHVAIDDGRRWTRRQADLVDH